MLSWITDRVERASDRALELVLPRVEAGACQPDTGQFCACINGFSCGYPHNINYRFIFNCNGDCVMQGCPYHC